ncbi:MAG: TetR/AcrR family transcriptional regulator [Deltaproteobacteria bacterium]|nr:TetR/AcrR family transcriptional regulator [Deltaproteobacteria bacterium]
MEDKQIPRREREKLRHRNDLIAAALRLFSEKGYHNVSMREIAEEAEFAVGTLYKFFKNKEDLYKVLMLEQADRFRDEITKAIKEPDDEVEKLRNYVRVKGKFFSANASMIRLYFAETQGSSFNVMAGLDSEMRERYYQLMQTLASLFERGIRKRRLKKIADPYSLAIALDSLTNAFLFLWVESPERHPFPKDPDTILDILFKGLVEH